MPRAKQLDDFTQAYIEAALWSTTDNSDESGGEPLDQNYSAADIAPETMDLILEDCADFQKRFGNLIDDDEPNSGSGDWSSDELAGHDFWLTREGHGAGFWDGDWPKHGDELTEAAKSYGGFDLYVGDDGLIYGPGPEWYRKHRKNPGRANEMSEARRGRRLGPRKMGEARPSHRSGSRLPPIEPYVGATVEFRGTQGTSYGHIIRFEGGYAMVRWSGGAISGVTPSKLRVVPHGWAGPGMREEGWAPGGARIMMARGGVVTIPGGRAHEYVPPHPDRTGYRNASGRDPMNFDVTFKEWPNRASLLKTIEMQGQREPRQDDWKDWLTSRYNPANRVTREMNEANPPEHRRRRALGGPPGPGRGTPHRNPDAGSLATELSKAVGGTTPKEAIHFNRDHEGYQFTTSSPEYNQKVVVVLSNEKGGNVALSIYADEARRNEYESINSFLFGPDGYTSRSLSVAAMKETIEDVWKMVDGYARSWDESEGGDMEEAPKKKKRAKPKKKRGK